MSDTPAYRLLQDGFDRVREIVDGAVDGLDPDRLSWRPHDTGNSIAWLTWHLTRISDDHFADAAGTPQVWVEQGWVDRFGLPFDPEATGYGHSSTEVDQVRVESGDLLRGYQHAVHEQNGRLLDGWDDAELDRVVDERWDPPVTLGVRLVSVLSDSLQHAGQARYVRGLL